MITLHLQIEDTRYAILPRFRCFPDQNANFDEALFAVELSAILVDGIDHAKFRDGTPAFPPTFVSAANHLFQEARAIKTQLYPSPPTPQTPKGNHT